MITPSHTHAHRKADPHHEGQQLTSQQQAKTPSAATAQSSHQQDHQHQQTAFADSQQHAIQQMPNKLGQHQEAVSAASQRHATQQQAAGHRPNQSDSADSLQHAAKQVANGHRPSQLSEATQSQYGASHQHASQQRLVGQKSAQPQQLESADSQQHTMPDRADWHRPNLFLGIMDRRHRWKGRNRAAIPALGPGLVKLLLEACHSVMTLAERTGRHDMLLLLVQSMQQVLLCYCWLFQQLHATHETKLSSTTAVPTGHG